MYWDHNTKVAADSRTARAQQLRGAIPLNAGETTDMYLSELVVTDSSVFAGSWAVQIGRAVHMQLVGRPVVDLAHWVGGTMLKLLVRFGREGGSGTTTIPDLGRSLASLLSL